MKKSRMTAFALLLCATLVGSASAQTDYPNKPIRMIVPFGAGAGVDTLARGVAKGLSERFGQPVVIDNRPGAGGNIGTEAAAKADPDGYTLVMGSNGPFAANVSLYSKLPFDPLTDLTPVILMGRLPMILVGSKSAPANSVQEVIAAAKARPGAVNFGASNTTARVWVELLKSMGGVDVPTVLYKNVGAMMTDLMSGQIQFAFENVGPSMPLIKGDKIKAIAVTSPKRAGFAPEIPTLAEAGLTRHELVVWLALFAPKNTPAAIVSKLNSEINRMITESAELKQLALSIGIDLAGGTPQQLGQYHAAEVRNWRSLVEMTNIRLE
ncbi:MAG: tripartite tricarboxylate transporter substrate binding protein [Burkholderiales bacterium]|nr:tripartite tricarboxylate transporter substrate binding protein [Burkholderiales bacterium]